MIVSIDRLKPLEKVFLHHLKNLSEMILKKGIVHTPIIADKKSGIVLDGSHRYIFFLMNGFRELPVRFVDYNDEHIRVGSRLIHRHLVEEKVEISKKEVKRRGLIGDLFSPRSTRHFFPFRKNERINVPLKLLIRGKNFNVEKYILAGSRVWGAALTNNDEELIVTNGNSDDISIIDLIKQTAVSSIPVGKTPHTVRVMK